ncbi:ferredoxin [Rhodococcus koreensis]|uniref:Ferredoxin n=1 Tax=Rhodococcus koreensis TaxID=99653 RepID=A0A1H4L678_9NOCA|nr:ferredoxin [Rhodococcus koreensis]SEB66257.1 ferredoxin [Rhodococcus koreensis]
MVKISVDLDKCQGYANCVVASPDVFDLSDDGKVDLLQTRIADRDVAEVEEAVRSCPAAALSMTEED